MSAKLDKITPQTPLRIRWLARHLHLSADVIYRAIGDGYALKYPWLKMTTVEHFLSWCEGQHTAVDTARVEAEVAKFIRGCQAAESASKHPEGRRRKAAGKSREPLSSHD